jgi:putative peptidoglycan lipid II flippase
MEKNLPPGKLRGSVFNTVLISSGLGLSKILGFIRETVIAGFFGASYLVDAYLVAQMVPQVLFSIIGSSLTTSVIPLVTEYKEKKGFDSVLALLNSITTIMLIISLVLVLLGWAFSGVIVHLVAPGFSGPAYELAVQLTNLMFPMIIFFGLAGLGSGILQSQKRFFFPSFMGIPYNIVIIAALIISARQWGIAGLAVGTVVAVAVQWLFQVPDLRRCGFIFRPRIDWQHPGLKQMLKLIIPVAIGTGVGQINLLVNRMLASGLAEGSIAALNYANKLNVLAYGVVGMAVARAIYPEMSAAAVVADHDKFQKSLYRSINSLLLLLLPFAVGMMILREPLVRLVYQRGAFDETAAHLTVIALLFYAIGMPFLSVREIVLRAFYSLQDTLTPMKIGLATVALNVGLNLVLVKYLAHGGLALGNSIATMVGFVILLWYLRKKLGRIKVSLMLISGLKIGLAAVLMGGVVYVELQWLVSSLGVGTLSFLIALLLCAGTGLIVYGLLIKMLQVEEFDIIYEKVRERWSRKG